LKVKQKVIVNIYMYEIIEEGRPFTIKSTLVKSFQGNINTPVIGFSSLYVEFSGEELT